MCCNTFLGQPPESRPAGMTTGGAGMSCAASRRPPESGDRGPSPDRWTASGHLVTTIHPSHDRMRSRPMSIAEALIPEFEQEMATTRRLLERVPGDRGPWKPHPKSFALGHLAQLVSWMPGWIANTVSRPELDLAVAPKYSFETSETLLAGFDRNVR